MRRLLLFFLFAGAVFASDCISAPCSLASNATYSLLGSPDTRLYSWGLHQDIFSPFTIAAPVGYAVRVLRVYGTLMAYPTALVPSGTYAGLLWALSTAQPASPPQVNFDPDTFLYLEYASTGGPVNQTFDFPLHTVLSLDGMLTAKGSIFTNTTGVTFQMEASFVLVYQFEKFAAGLALR